MPPPVSLKQRLAALSISPSSPTSPYGQEPRSPLSVKRKTLFTPPWSKRQQHEPVTTNGASELVQEVMTRMIFQAGVDFESVTSSSSMPLF